MFRRSIPALCAALLMCSSAVPVLAGSRMIAQKSSPGPYASVYLTQGLLPGHKYKIEVTSSGHSKFAGLGTLNYSYVSNNLLRTGSKGLTLGGTTPHAVVIKPPTAGRLLGWILLLDVRLKTGHGVAVRVYDLGRSR